MDHPFHLHGFLFQVLDTTSAATPLAWRDTVNVPVNGIFRIARIPAERPGDWMYLQHPRTPRPRDDGHLTATR